MRIIFGIVLAFLLAALTSARAATIVSGTITLTNSAALTNATSAQSYTLNGNDRTFTNSVANAATQILVHTNDSASTIALSLVAQAGAYPFTGQSGLRLYGATNIVFRMAPDTAITITLTPTNWGVVTYSTQTVGTVQTPIQVPFSVYGTETRTNLATQLWSDLDSNSQDRGLGKVDFDGRVEFGAGFGLHGATKTASYTLATNDVYVGADTRSNTNLILSLPSAASASNLLFVLKDEGGAAATNTIKIYPVSGDRIDTLFTNLVVSNNFGGAILRSRGSTNWDIIASGGANGFASGASVLVTNTLWVTKNGINSRAISGDLGRTFLTLAAANTNAVSGDTIYVMPGSYDEAGIVLKNGVHWNFAAGAEVVNTTNGAPIFTAGASVRARITGSGVFTNAGAGGYEVLYQSGTNSDIYFECLRASGGHASDFYHTIRADSGALRVRGGTIVGFHYPAVLVSGTATAYFDGVTLDSTLNDQALLGSSLVTAATNIVTLKNCTVLGSNDGSWGATVIYSVHATTAKTVYLDGTLNANLPPNPNVTFAGIDYAGLGEQHLAGNVFVRGNATASGTNYSSHLVSTNGMATNAAPVNIDASDFALDTYYTNGTGRAWVSASVLLSANTTNAAQVSLYLDQDADAAFEQTGTTVSAFGFVTNTVQLSGWIQPGGVFVFTNLSGGAATAAVNAGGSQWVKQ